MVNGATMCPEYNTGNVIVRLPSPCPRFKAHYGQRFVRFAPRCADFVWSGTPCAGDHGRKQEGQAASQPRRLGKCFTSTVV